MERYSEMRRCIPFAFIIKAPHLKPGDRVEVESREGDIYLCVTTDAQTFGGKIVRPVD